MDRESAHAPGSCTADIIEPACGGLFEITGNVPKLLDFVIQYPTEGDLCPDTLRNPKDSCFMALRKVRQEYMHVAHIHP